MKTAQFKIMRPKPLVSLLVIGISAFVVFTGNNFLRHRFNFGASSGERTKNNRLRQSGSGVALLNESEDSSILGLSDPTMLEEVHRNLQETGPIVSRDNYLGVIFPEPEKMPFYLRNTMMPMNANDLVFMWHVPKTAGGLMKVIMGTCYGLRRAEKLENPASMEMVKDTVLNVDTATPAGIKEAKVFNIADSGMIDVIISPYALSASSLFTNDHHGRAFTLLRHPIDTAAANFFFRKARNAGFRNLKLTFVDYVAQSWYPDNFMTRQLTGVLPGEELTERHLEHAMHLLSSKFFIGITEQLEETMRQLRVYYGWTELPGKEGCAMNYVRGGDPNFKPTSRPKPPRGSDEWAMIAEKERFDMALYYFGLEIFSRQGNLLPATGVAPAPPKPPIEKVVPPPEPAAKPDATYF